MVGLDGIFLWVFVSYKTLYFGQSLENWKGFNKWRCRRYIISRMPLPWLLGVLHRLQDALCKKGIQKTQPSPRPPPPHTRYGDKNPVGTSRLRFPWWLHSAALPIGWVSCSGFSNRGSDTRLLPDWPGWCCSAMATGAEGPVFVTWLNRLTTKHVKCRHSFWT